MTTGRFANALVVLDSPAVGFATDPRVVVHWSSMDVPAGHVSLPALVEENGLALKDEYTRWLYELGDLTLGTSKSVRATLAIDDGLSFWWLTTIAEKSPFKSGAMYRVFKLRMLERVYASTNATGIFLRSDDRELRAVLKRWCADSSVPFGHARESSTDDDGPIVSRVRITPWRQRLPLAVQGAAVVGRLLVTRLRLLGARREMATAKQQATVVSYVPHFDDEAARDGKFRSRFWESVHSVLDSAPGVINWIWIYGSGAQASYGDMVAHRDRFDAAYGGRQRFFLFEDFINSKVVFRAIALHVRMTVKSWALKARGIRRHFVFAGSTLNFWPLLQGDWDRSFAGAAAMHASIWHATLTEIAGSLPPQRWCLFLWENQPWERALVHAWRRVQHTPLIGAQHGAVAPLDLRYFDDPRAYTTQDFPFPLPDTLAVNGAGPRDLVRSSGFPADRIRTVEALRYMHLSPQSQVPARPVDGERIVLVVGDYMAAPTRFLFALLVQAAKDGALETYDRVWIKPHPFCPVDRILAELRPSFMYELIDGPISDHLARAAVVCCANPTSVVIESLTAKLPTIICAWPNSMNLSMAYGMPGVDIVFTAEQLAGQLRNPPRATLRSDYFSLDPALPNWKHLLEAEPTADRPLDSCR